LSNFYKCNFSYKGIVFTTSEHAFQWEKIESDVDKLKILQAQSTQEAKKLGNSLKIKHDWNNTRKQIMKDILICKFQNKNLKTKLLETKIHKLIEGNSWHDNFWGDCSCTRCENKIGLNNLGFILTSVRNFYANDSTHPFF
jgi:ribA/ribD-fused uncharacterized protein